MVFTTWQTKSWSKSYKLQLTNHLGVLFEKKNVFSIQSMKKGRKEEQEAFFKTRQAMYSHILVKFVWNIVSPWMDYRETGNDASVVWEASVNILMFNFSCENFKSIVKELYYLDWSITRSEHSHYSPWLYLITLLTSKMSLLCRLSPAIHGPHGAELFANSNCLQSSLTTDVHRDTVLKSII